MKFKLLCILDYQKHDVQQFPFMRLTRLRGDFFSFLFSSPGFFFSEYDNQTKSLRHPVPQVPAMGWDSSGRRRSESQNVRANAELGYKLTYSSADIYQPHFKATVPGIPPSHTLTATTT